MSDKLSAEIDNDVHHNEKHQVHEKAGVDLSETAGRRASVALNIVENPLQVSLRSMAWLALRPRRCALGRQLMLVFFPAPISTTDCRRCPCLC
jgi:hypothetical protein